MTSESVLMAMGIDHILLRIKREAGISDAPAIVARPLPDYGDER
jgi:hypothetical protein